MPRAKKKQDRVFQVAAWLQHHFEPPKEVRIEIREITKEQDEVEAHGYCLNNTSHFLIVLDPRARVGEMIDTLIHEWAHVRMWYSADFLIDGCKHPNSWGVEMARIYRRFHDEKGVKDSEHYPW